MFSKPILIMSGSPEASIARLQDHNAGFGQNELMYLSMALKKELGDSSHITAHFFNDVPTAEGQRQVEDSHYLFELFVNAIVPPVRFHIPIGVRNHMLGCVLEIDKNNNANILIFDPLGNSEYDRSYQYFIDILAQRFGSVKVNKTTKKFQYLERSDYQCGDWSLWFLKESSRRSHLSLMQLATYFDTLKREEIPDRFDLRRNHIQLLKRHHHIDDDLSLRNGEPITREVMPEFDESMLLTLKQIYSQQHKHHFGIGENTINYDKKIWAITLDDKLVSGKSTTFFYNEESHALTFDQINPANTDMIDAYFKLLTYAIGKKGMHPSQVSIDLDQFTSFILQTVIKNRAKIYGYGVIEKNVSAIRLFGNANTVETPGQYGSAPRFTSTTSKNI